MIVYNSTPTLTHQVRWEVGYSSVLNEGQGNISSKVSVKKYENNVLRRLMHNFEVVTISSIQHGSTHIHPKSRNLGKCNSVFKLIGFLVLHRRPEHALGHGFTTAKIK